MTARLTPAAGGFEGAASSDRLLDLALRGDRDEERPALHQAVDVLARAAHAEVLTPAALEHVLARLAVELVLAREAHELVPTGATAHHVVAASTVQGVAPSEVDDHIRTPRAGGLVPALLTYDSRREAVAGNRRLACWSWGWSR